MRDHEKQSIGREGYSRRLQSLSPPSAECFRSPVSTNAEKLFGVPPLTYLSSFGSIDTARLPTST